MRITLSTALCITFIAGVANSHEFWIDPVSYQVQKGETVEAHLRVGQAFEGSSYSYIPQKFRRFEYVLDAELRDMPGTVGDRPAAKLTPDGEGLLVLVHETTDNFITWDDFQDFVTFVVHKDAEWTLAEHAARGLAENGTREVYSRYAKALVAIGAGEGSDREVGLVTELVALENPYTGQTGDGVDVRLLYQGEPRRDAQIEVFEKAPDGTVKAFMVRTDDTGKATVPVQPGYRYMADAVVLRGPSQALADERDVQWESLWANLTFGVPD